MIGRENIIKRNIKLKKIEKRNTLGRGPFDQGKGVNAVSGGIAVRNPD